MLPSLLALRIEHEAAANHVGATSPPPRLGLRVQDLGRENGVHDQDAPQAQAQAKEEQTQKERQRQETADQRQQRLRRLYLQLKQQQQGRRGAGGGGGSDSVSVAQEPTYTTSAAGQRLRETLQSNFKTIQEVEAERSAKSATQTDPLDMQVKLGLDFHVAGPSNSLERAEFEEVLVCDLCKASGLTPLSFHVKNMSPGSVVVSLLVLGDPTGGGPSPRDAGMALQSQVKDPNSTLRAGTLTRHTIAITFPSEAFQKGSPTSGTPRGTPQDLEHEMRGRMEAEVREQHVEAEISIIREEGRQEERQERERQALRKAEDRQREEDESVERDRLVAEDARESEARRLEAVREEEQRREGEEEKRGESEEEKLKSERSSARRGM